MTLTRLFTSSAALLMAGCAPAPKPDTATVMARANEILAQRDAEIAAIPDPRVREFLNYCRQNLCDRPLSVPTTPQRYVRPLPDTTNAIRSFWQARDQDEFQRQLQRTIERALRD
jgi:hypothetical protein